MHQKIDSSTVRETNTCLILNVSKFWAGQVENWPGPVDFYIEHVRDILFWESAPGGRLNKKDGLSRCGDSHVKDKMS